MPEGVEDRHDTPVALLPLAVSVERQQHHRPWEAAGHLVSSKCTEGVHSQKSVQYLKALYIQQTTAVYHQTSRNVKNQLSSGSRECSGSATEEGHVEVQSVAILNLLGAIVAGVCSRCVPQNKTNDQLPGFFIEYVTWTVYSTKVELEAS